MFVQFMFLILILCFCSLSYAMNVRERERKLHFNNLLHIHQHAFLKFMMQSVIEGKNQMRNMSVYDIPL